MNIQNYYTIKLSVFINVVKLVMHSLHKHDQIYAFIVFHAFKIVFLQCTILYSEQFLHDGWSLQDQHVF